MFGICRVRNLNMSDLATTQQHNNREYEPGERPGNTNLNLWGHAIDESRQYMFDEDENTIFEGVKNRLDKNKITVRDGDKRQSIVALEYVLSISPEWWKKTATEYNDSAALDVLSKFVIDRHGVDNIVSVAKHFDETTPHIHIVCTPIENKKVKWKNRNGEGFKIKPTLNAAAYTNKKSQYRDLQTDYHKFVNEWSQSRFNIPIKRGIDAREQQRKYCSQTIQSIGLLKEELLSVRDSMRKIMQDFKEENIKQQEALKRLKEKGQEQMIINQRINDMKKDVQITTEKIKKSEKSYPKNKKTWRKPKDTGLTM